MCYNKETSLLMYIIGITLSIILYFSGDKYDKHIALLSFVFIQMQLAEFFMWYDEDCKKGINNIATYLALILLLLQPVSIIIGAIIFKTTNIPNNILYTILSVFIIIVVFCAVFSTFEVSNKMCSKNKKDHPHLIWDIDFYDKNYVIVTIIYFLIFLIFLFFKDFNKGIIVITIITILLFDSIYNTTKYIREYESVWCLKAVSVPFLIILYNFIRNIKY